MHVIREREAILALQGAGWPYLPRLLLAGNLQLFPRAPAGCLSGAPAVLTELAGRPLVADEQVPVLPPQELIALASCGLTAICELRVSALPAFAEVQYVRSASEFEVLQELL